MKIINIVGARPNFVKMAPLIREMRRYSDVSPLLVHTGQHYDFNMAERFFQDLSISAPDVSLEVGAGSHAYQTAEVMKRLEPILEQERPDLVLVVGDVNSTMAAALTAVKLHIPVAHVEAGLRSFDRAMPEEINRLVTDAVSSYLFVTEESGRRNLLAEGVDPEKMFFVGNVMIDSLESCRTLWERSSVQARLGLSADKYALVTLHRPSSVDCATTLEGIISVLEEIGEELPVVFPVHPRTRHRLNGVLHERRASLRSSSAHREARLLYVDPLGYLDFMCLVANARLVLTDSGGLQEETTILGVPCLTLRDSTERPVTVSHGTNRLVGTRPQMIREGFRRMLSVTARPPVRPPLWDGMASQRIVAILRGAREPRADMACGKDGVAEAYGRIGHEQSLDPTFLDMEEHEKT